MLVGAAGLLATAVFVAFAGSAERTPSAATALAEIERMIDRAGYGLTQVSLTGHRFTPDSDILDAIDFASTPTMLSFDGRAAQARIEALSWVEKASIERVFPDRLDVRITERTPFAAWRRGERHYLIDKTGRVLAPVPETMTSGLPRLAGEGAPGEAAALLTLLAERPALRQLVELAERVGERRWTLHLTGGVAIHLPADGVPEALTRAAALASAGELARAGEIDLRVAGRMLRRDRQGAQAATGGT